MSPRSTPVRFVGRGECIMEHCRSRSEIPLPVNPVSPAARATPMAIDPRDRWNQKGCTACTRPPRRGFLHRREHPRPTAGTDPRAGGARESKHDRRDHSLAGPEPVGGSGPVARIPPDTRASAGAGVVEARRTMDVGRSGRRRGGAHLLRPIGRTRSLLSFLKSSVPPATSRRYSPLPTHTPDSLSLFNFEPGFSPAATNEARHRSNRVR